MKKEDGVRSDKVRELIQGLHANLETQTDTLHTYTMSTTSEWMEQMGREGYTSKEITQAIVHADTEVYLSPNPYCKTGIRSFCDPVTLREKLETGLIGYIAGLNIVVMQEDGSPPPVDTLLEVQRLLFQLAETDIPTE